MARMAVTVVFLATLVVVGRAQDLWVPTRNMTTAREYHTATTLADGVRVLITGGGDEGYDSDDFERTSEVYDARTGAWALVGNMTRSRYQHTATLLGDGTVLVIGGLNNETGTPTFETSAELFNATSGRWTATTGTMRTGRYVHTATLVSTSPAAGSVVVITGGYSNAVAGAYLATTEAYNPATKTFTAAGNLTTPRFYHTASVVTVPSSSPGGVNVTCVLVTGGSNGVALRSAELFNVTTGTWAATGPLNVARAYHTQTTLADGRVLVAGGSNFSGDIDTAEVYDPRTGTWTLLPGRLNVGRYYHTATLLAGGAVLVVGGFGPLGYLDEAELFDPATGLWTLTGPLLGIHYRHTAALLAYGYVLVSGGFNGAQYLKTSQLYLPTIAQLPSPGVPGPSPAPTSPPAAAADEGATALSQGGIVAVVLLSLAVIAIVVLSVALYRARRNERDPDEQRSLLTKPAAAAATTTA